MMRAQRCDEARQDALIERHPFSRCSAPLAEIAHAIDGCRAVVAGPQSGASTSYVTIVPGLPAPRLVSRIA